VLLGGGGTDMTVGIQTAMDLRPSPSVLVVLTDGYTPWPAEPPKARVVAGLLVDRADDLSPPPAQPPVWTTTVEITAP
jgi:predicted metal-dependent peptidase